MLDASMACLTADHGVKEKLRPRRLGPFKVLAVPTPVTVKLDLPTGNRIHDVIHVSHVLPFRTSAQYPRTVPQDRPKATGRKKGARTYLIERIVSKTADGMNYIIKWQGWPTPSPHPVAEIKADQPEIAAAFERTLKTAPSPARRLARARHPARATR